MLQYPIPLLEKYFSGEEKGMSKGASLKSGTAIPGAAKITKTGKIPVAELILIQQEVASKLRSKLSENPLIFQEAAESNGALYGSLSATNVYDALGNLGIESFKLVVPHANQVSFITDQGKSQKIKQIGKYKAFVNVPLIGSVSFQVEVLNASLGTVITPKIAAQSA
jgi:ribosomal protein L9